jgi:hypothetical protein
MAYTEIDDPSAYFQTTLYTGNGSNDLSITNSGNSDLQPDLVWIKQRDSRDHFLFDSVRGVLQYVASNTTAAESTLSDGLKSFNSNGFTIDDGIGINQNNDPHVSWNWKAGGSASNNTDGDITSSVNVNQEAGFSIIKYDSNNTAGQTVGHGLGVTPNFLIFKKIDGTTNWHCWSDTLATTNYINLNLSDAQSSSSDWISVSNSLITLKTNWGVTNDGGNFICYAFANKQGYSKFGSYTGNGNADGVFVYLGFKPSFVMTKCFSASGQSWHMQDNKRDGFNYNNHRLFADSSGGEETTVRMDLLSNGFKYRDGDGQTNGATYIYMAFAEAPFVTSTGVPATAR